VLVGAGLGIPVSYLAQPSSVQLAMSLPDYLANLIKSLAVWHEGNVTEFLRLTFPMWMTSLAMAVAGALTAHFLRGVLSRFRVGNRSSG
jgi:hypothetical protein